MAIVKLAMNSGRLPGVRSLTNFEPPDKISLEA